jgi:hypothetical protein
MRLCLILLVCPFLQGCLAFGYPSTTQTPSIVVNDPEVKAFRMTRDWTTYGAIIAGAFEIADSIEDIPIADNMIPPQRDSYFNYHYLVFGFGAGHDRSVSVYLYRRGYETVVVEAHSSLAWWRQQSITPAWKKAETLQAQEKAIDELNVRFGYRTNAVASFVAGEYAALAKTAKDEESRKTLEEKAREALAGQYWKLKAADR